MFQLALNQLVRGKALVPIFLWRAKAVLHTFPSLLVVELKVLVSVARAVFVDSGIAGGVHSLNVLEPLLNATISRDREVEEALLTQVLLDNLSTSHAWVLVD